MKHKNSHENLFLPFQNLTDPSGLTQEGVNDTLSMVLDAVNSSISGLIVTDLTGKIRYANPSFCRIFDYDLGEVMEKNAAELFSTGEIRTFSDVISIMNNSQENSLEFKVEDKNGNNRIVEITASNVSTSKGDIVGRMASFIDITKRKEIENDREQLIKKLQHALDTIKILRGIIPICASCKKIRDDKGFWKQLETYLIEHSEAIFTHGICPECSDRLYPGLKKNTSHRKSTIQS